MNVKLYHNSRCAKSRATLALLEQRRIPFEIVDYLRSPLTLTELEALLAKRGLPARELVRHTEPEFKASGLDLDGDEARLLELLAAEPKLLQRPIVEAGSRARIGRPPEHVLELFD